MVNSLLGCSDQASVKVACFYLTPKQDDFNKSPEIQVCIAEALYDVDSIVVDPGAYTREELAALRSQVMSNLNKRGRLRVGVRIS